MRTKICNKCKIEKEVTFFSKRNLKSGFLSFNSWCKSCKSKDNKERTLLKCGNKKVDDLEGEIWVITKDYNSYQVSNFGRIKSLPKSNRPYERLISPRIQSNGRYSIPLYNGRKGTLKRFSLHRLIAIAFIPNPDNKPCINHINNNPLDNRIENLEWCTHQENTNHAKKCNRFQLGEERYNNVVTEKDVLDIFNSSIPQRTIAKKYNINQGTVAKIKTGQNWGHLTGKKYVKNFNKFGKCNKSIT